MTLQAYIETDIQKYSPAPGDLAYPEKLIIVSVGSCKPLAVIMICVDNSEQL